MKNQNKVQPLQALKTKAAAEFHFINEVKTDDPLMLADSLKQVHDLALYNADSLDTGEIASLYFVNKLEADLRQLGNSTAN